MTDFTTTRSLGQLQALPLCTVVRVSGCVSRRWPRGKHTFARIDTVTSQVQVLLNREEVGGDEPHSYRAFVRDLRAGDVVGVEGELFLSKAEELTIRVARWVRVTDGEARD